MSMVRCGKCGRIYPEIPAACACGNEEIRDWSLVPDAFAGDFRPDEAPRQAGAQEQYTQQQYTQQQYVPPQETTQQYAQQQYAPPQETVRQYVQQPPRQAQQGSFTQTQTVTVKPVKKKNGSKSLWITLIIVAVISAAMAVGVYLEKQALSGTFYAQDTENATVYFDVMVFKGGSVTVTIDGNSMTVNYKIKDKTFQLEDSITVNDVKVPKSLEFRKDGTDAFYLGDVRYERSPAHLVIPTKSVEEEIENLLYQGNMAKAAQKYNEAMRYYKSAVEKGDTSGTAMNQIGVMLYEGMMGTKDPAKAFEWFTKAVETSGEKNATAMRNLATCYHDGSGTQIDDEKALYYYQKSLALEDDAEAYNEAGYILFSGEVTDADHDTAFKYFKKAAEMGNATAMGNLAYCYENGFGTEKDADKAAEWRAKKEAAQSSGSGTGE